MSEGGPSNSLNSSDSSASDMSSFPNQAPVKYHIQSSPPLQQQLLAPNSGTISDFGPEKKTDVAVPVKDEVLLEQQRQKPLWPGNNRFCCNMRIIYGPPTDNGPLAFGWGSLIGAAAIFWGTICPYIWLVISPAIPIIGTFFLFLAFYLYGRATFMDPGIIPRQPLQNELNAMYNGVANERTQRVTLEKLRGDIYHPNEPLQVANASLPECSTCKILRPHLSSHCRYCDNCVEGFDHHCNWIGNCVGQRNHRYFVGFILTTTVCCFYLCGSAILFLASKATLSSISGTVQEVFAFILAISLGILFCFMLNVTLWHLELVMCGQTLKMRDRNGVKRTGCKKAWINLFRFFSEYKPRTAYFDTRHVRYMPEKIECC